jgi:hypothetical protein
MPDGLPVAARIPIELFGPQRGLIAQVLTRQIGRSITRLLEGDTRPARCEEDGRYVARRIANDASDVPGDGAHCDGDQGGRSHIRGLDRAGDGDQRQSEGIEPQVRLVA